MKRLLICAAALLLLVSAANAGEKKAILIMIDGLRADALYSVPTPNLDSLRDVQDELIDRYGDIPKSVMNLLDISLYKSRAEELCLASVTVKAEEAKLVFAPEARIDPAGFMRTVASIEGAQVLTKAPKSGESGMTTLLLIKRKRNTQEAMFEAAKEAINKLLECAVSAEEA